MKTRKSQTAIIMASTVVVSSLLVGFSVFAQNNNLSDQQLEQIKSECLSTKNTLNQLHISDALLRVNRGQTYESMYTKLMDKFNDRLFYNKLDNSTLVSTADQYKTMLEGFRTDYQNYEEQLTKTINVDCSNHPAQFYEYVASARTKRELVHADILKLNLYIDQYQLALDQFSQEYNRSQGVELNE